MNSPKTSRDEYTAELRMERLVGRLLQVGVLLAAAVVLVGGAMLLVQFGSARAAFSVFQGEPEHLRSLFGIWHAAIAGDSRGIVQLGLVLLILTPVARVALTLVAFALQRDRVFVAITAVVLAVLFYGLFWSPS
jgi:uncharacterized membrane protein